MNAAGENRRAFLYALLFLALIVRGLVPAGFMPAPEGGKTRIVICTASGPAAVMVDAGKFPSKDHGKKEHQGSPSCPYAPVLAQNTPEIPEAYLPADRYADAHDLLPATDAPSALSSKPWLSRGPPLS